MADVSYSKTATERRNNTGVTLGKGDAGNVKNICSTIELAASSAGSTVKLARVPSAARICGASTLYWDDISTNSPDYDIGFASVDANITSDPDALNDGLDGASAGSARMVKDVADIGKRAWEYVNGQTSDPGGELDLYLSVTVAATTSTGTITSDLYYTLD